MKALAILFTAVLGSAVRANEGRPPFVVHTADGKSAEGPLRELGADWSVKVGEAQIDGGDVLTVRRAGRPRPPAPAGPQLLLAGGDRVPIVRDERTGPLLVGERLHFRCPYIAGGEDTSVPLSAVSAVWFADAAGEDPERLRRRLAQETRKRDAVLLRNGDALEGVLTGLDERTVTIEVDRKPVALSVGRTAAVALSSELTEAPKPKGVFARLVLDAPAETADGARLSLASARLADDKTLAGTTLFGAAVSIPLTRVAALDLFGGKALYLSDLKPSHYEYFSYLDDHWEYSRDAEPTGLDLRVGGSAYDKGVGLHSRARLTYAVPLGCRRFEALAGPDDRTGRAGGVRVRLLADGKPLDLDGDATAGPLAVGVDVAGVKELTLEADFGKDGPVLGRVDWADARFVK
jgi:hypothetical protein